MPYDIKYFKKLAAVSLLILDDLPIELTPQPLDYALEKLKPSIEEKKNSYLKILSEIPKIPESILPRELAVGLNTIGMLTDRFTILLIREWCIRNKGVPDSDKADHLYKTQTFEIMKALAEALPGYSSLNSKITAIKADADALNWEESFYNLLTTNLLLWESQEVLYIKDIKTLPTEEIRDYIKWFSYGNILRNEYIQLCEELYWKEFS